MLCPWIAGFFRQDPLRYRLVTAGFCRSPTGFARTSTPADAVSSTALRNGRARRSSSDSRPPYSCGAAARAVAVIATSIGGQVTGKHLIAVSPSQNPTILGSRATEALSRPRPARVLEYRILGPLEVVGKQGPLRLGGPKSAPRSGPASQRVPVVSVHRLADDLYSGATPATAVSQCNGRSKVAQLLAARPGSRLVRRGT